MSCNFPTISKPGLPDFLFDLLGLLNLKPNINIKIELPSLDTEFSFAPSFKIDLPFDLPNLNLKPNINLKIELPGLDTDFPMAPVFKIDLPFDLPNLNLKPNINISIPLPEPPCGLDQ